jgi:hypothetical protein
MTLKTLALTLAVTTLAIPALAHGPSGDRPPTELARGDRGNGRGHDTRGDVRDVGDNGFRYHDDVGHDDWLGYDVADHRDHGWSHDDGHGYSDPGFDDRRRRGQGRAARAPRQVVVFQDHDAFDDAIARGVRSGALTHREVYHLSNRLDALRRTEARAARDGYVDRREAQQIAAARHDFEHMLWQQLNDDQRVQSFAPHHLASGAIHHDGC